MDQHKKSLKYTEQGRSDGKKEKKPGYLKKIAEKAHGVNLFYVLSGIMQMLLGFIVTISSLLHLIRPIWLAAFLSLLGCVVSMFGLYQTYDTLKQSHSARDLARHAIERAIRDRN